MNGEGLSLEPLIGAIAAGCTAVIKPSELSPASSALLAEAIPTYIDSEAVKIIQGGVDVCGQLLQYKWDKILFTGPIFSPLLNICVRNNLL